MTNLAMKILQWQTNGSVGISSATMASIAAGLENNFYGGRFDAPHDPADMLRCIGLVEEIPEIRNHFHAIAEKVKPFKGIIEHWDELVSLIKKECIGEKWRAPESYKLIKQLRETA